MSYSFVYQEVVEAALKSVSISDMARELGFSINNTPKRRALLEFMLENKIDPPKRTTKGHKRKSLPEYLVVNGPPIHSNELKKKLLAEGLIENKCSNPTCPNPDPIWDNKELVFHLDHTNGNSKDNRIVNLRLLCPNCHSQTHTYCGRNNKGIKTYSVTKTLDDLKDQYSKEEFTFLVEKYGRRKVSKYLGISEATIIHFIGKNVKFKYSVSNEWPSDETLFGNKKQGKTYAEIAEEIGRSPEAVRSRMRNKGLVEKLQKEKEKTICVDCGKEINTGSSRCRSCFYEWQKGVFRPSAQKILWPEDEELLNMLEESNFVQVGKKLGVSDNAIRKHLKRRNLTVLRRRCVVRRPPMV